MWATASRRAPFRVVADIDAWTSSGRATSAGAPAGARRTLKRISSTLGLVIVVGTVLLLFLALAHSQPRKGSGIEPRESPDESLDGRSESTRGAASSEDAGSEPSRHGGPGDGAGEGPSTADQAEPRGSGRKASAPDRDRKAVDREVPRAVAHGGAEQHPEAAYPAAA